MEESTLSGTRLFTHDLPTNGIVYLDVGFNLHTIPADLLPYLSIFSRSLLQTGTAREDFVSLSQRIGRSTGGIGPSRAISAMANGNRAAAWLFLRGKSTAANADEMLAILHDVITSARLDNRERIRQMILEEKSALEGRLAGMGNGLVSMRLRASLHEADWANELTGGVSYLFFLRELAKTVDDNWDAIPAALFRIRDIIVNKATMVVNVTADQAIWSEFRGRLAGFLDRLPQAAASFATWGPLREPRSEGLTFPAKVNFVGKGADLRQLGFTASGATAVAVKHLNTGWLWDKVRVQGGAYGGSSSFDPFSGGFTFASYRDPNVTKTIDAYDGAAQFLAHEPTETELTRSIIGVIGSIDTYRLPDSKGFTAMMRELAGDTEADRQRRREEVLGASHKDFKALGEALSQLARTGQVVVLGSEAAIKAANDERGGFLNVTRVL